MKKIISRLINIEVTNFMGYIVIKVFFLKGITLAVFVMEPGSEEIKRLTKGGIMEIDL